VRVYLVKPKSRNALGKLMYSAPYIPSVRAYLMFEKPKSGEVEAVELEVEAQVLLKWIEEAVGHLQRRIWKQEYILKRLYDIMAKLVRFSEELAKA